MSHSHTWTEWVKPGDLRSRQVIRRQAREAHPGARIKIMRVDKIIDAPIQVDLSESHP